MTANVGELFKDLEHRERMILMMSFCELEMDSMLLDDWSGFVDELKGIAAIHKALNSDISVDVIENIVGRFEETMRVKESFTDRNTIKEMAERQLRELGLL